MRPKALGVATVVAATVAASPAGHRPPPHEATAVFAAGCYWGVEWVFEHVRGVQSVVAGFAIPDTTGTTRRAGYAEAVRIVYDPARVTYADLLSVFFLVAHDPTEVDRQGPDVGPQYRSVIFAANGAERAVARTMIDSLTRVQAFPAPIATEIAPLRGFREVDASQQDYVVHHPNEAYVTINDAPKLDVLRRRFPAFYRAEGGR